MIDKELEELAYNNIPQYLMDCKEHGFNTGDYEPAEDHSDERECFVEGFEKGFRKGELNPSDEIIEKIAKLTFNYYNHTNRGCKQIDYIKEHWND